MRGRLRKTPAGARPVSQKRSADTSRRIAAALEELLKSKHFEQVTMAELAASAGITPGAIYRRFAAKEALLPHVFERYREELTLWLSRVTAERLTDGSASLEAALARLVAETLACFRANRHIFRTVHLYGRLHPEIAPGGAAGVNDDFAPVGALIRRFAARPEAETAGAAQLIGHVLVSACVERALYPDQMPARGVAAADPDFCRGLAAMFAAWLKS